MEERRIKEEKARREREQQQRERDRRERESRTKVEPGFPSPLFQNRQVAVLELGGSIQLTFELGVLISGQF